MIILDGILDPLYLAVTEDAAERQLAATDRLQGNIGHCSRVNEQFNFFLHDFLLPLSKTILGCLKTINL